MVFKLETSSFFESVSSHYQQECRELAPFSYLVAMLVLVTYIEPDVFSLKLNATLLSFQQAATFLTCKIIFYIDKHHKCEELRNS